MDNILYNLGDVLLITVNPKINGKITFSGYVENITGETLTRSLIKEFRVSSENIFWTDWNELNQQNISSKEFITENSLIIQIRYTRSGSDTTGIIQFNDIQFNGVKESIEFNAPVLNNSIFANLIGTDNSKKIENNLFKKLYFRGILPTYIKRGDNLSLDEDKDFVDLFFSISRFFGLFFSFFKRFENFYQDDELLREQVRQYGLYFDESNVKIEDLQLLCNGYLDEIRKRGTIAIFRKRGEILPNGKTVEIDGEFRRLLRMSKNDELLYENIPLHKSGWCLGNSSPIYKGVNSNILNKTLENTENFVNLNNFSIHKNGINSNFQLKTVNGKTGLSISTNGGYCGLGRIYNTDNIDFLMNVDSNLDYEICFDFKIITGNSNDCKILFGVEGFNSIQLKLNDSFSLPDKNSVSELFFDKNVNNFSKNHWYSCRGIIYSYNSNSTENNKTNLGFGNNLYFNNKFTKFILPKIQVHSLNNDIEIIIHNYKVRPLIRGKNILPTKSNFSDSQSLGFIESSQIFYTYARNNNNFNSEQELTNIIERYLYPFNSTDLFCLIND